MTKDQVLQACTVEGNIVKLPPGQLDRKLYQEVAKSLQLIGGAWKGGKVMGFVFPSNPSELLAEISEGSNRNLKKEFQFFATPAALATTLVSIAQLSAEDTVLEPSAGQGAIISEINKVWAGVPDCYELMPQNVSVLNQSGLRFHWLDYNFLNHTCGKYTKIIANPPFTKNQDIKHLLKMYECLADGGKLVCVTSDSWREGSQKIQSDFRKWLIEVKASDLPLPRGTFKESGTDVGGNIIVINKKRV